MAEISSYANSIGNIVEGQLRDVGLHLQQQSQRLADATGSSKESYLTGSCLCLDYQ